MRASSAAEQRDLPHAPAPGGRGKRSVRIIPPPLPTAKEPPPLPIGEALLRAQHPSAERIARERENLARQQIEAQISNVQSVISLIEAHRHHHIQDEREWEHALALRTFDLALGELIAGLEAHADTQDADLLARAKRAQASAQEILRDMNTEEVRESELEDASTVSADTNIREDGERISGVHLIEDRRPETSEEDMRHHQIEAKIASAHAKIGLIDSQRHHGIHSEQDWEHALELRTRELELAELIDELRAEDSAENSDLIARAAIAQKAARDALQTIHADAIEGSDDEAWDDIQARAEHEGKEALQGITDTEIDEILNATFDPTIEHARAEARREAQITKEAIDEALRLSEETSETIQGHAEFDRITPVDLEAALDHAIPTAPEVNRRLMDIPATFEATQRKTDALTAYVRKIEAAADAESITKGDLRAALEDLNHTFQRPLEERLHLIQLSPARSEKPDDEAALIADALHRIEDATHRFKSAQDTAPERIESLENLLGRKTELRDALVRISTALVDALEKAGMKHPEIEMTTYTQSGILSGIKRLFGSPASKIRPNTLQDIIDDVKRAQAHFNARYYASDERKRHTQEHGHVGGTMPVDQLDDHADVFAVWKAIHAEIEALSQDVDDAATAQEGKGEAKKNARLQARVGELQARDAEKTMRWEEINEAKKFGIPDAEDIIREIQEDPYADRLTFDGHAFVNQMTAVAKAIKAKDEASISAEALTLARMNEELLEKGIKIDAGADLIERASKRKTIRHNQREKKAA